ADIGTLNSNSWQGLTLGTLDVSTLNTIPVGTSGQTLLTLTDLETGAVSTWNSTMGSSGAFTIRNGHHYQLVSQAEWDLPYNVDPSALLSLDYTFTRTAGFTAESLGVPEPHALGLAGLAALLAVRVGRGARRARSCREVTDRA
ncbi:MAG: hypothetical protein D6776_04710, partial [Planctomycetota bacterium]